jgi:hypothetical protein
MTVQEFIEKLQTFDPQLRVLIDSGNEVVFEPKIEFVCGNAVISPND